MQVLRREMACVHMGCAGLYTLAMLDWMETAVLREVQIRVPEWGLDGPRPNKKQKLPVPGAVLLQSRSKKLCKRECK